MFDSVLFYILSTGKCRTQKNRVLFLFFVTDYIEHYLLAYGNFIFSASTNMKTRKKSP